MSLIDFVDSFIFYLVRSTGARCFSGTSESTELTQQQGHTDSAPDSELGLFVYVSAGSSQMFTSHFVHNGKNKGALFQQR